MAIAVVAIRAQIDLGLLRTTGEGLGAATPLLLRQNAGQFKRTHFRRGFHPKKGSTSTHQRISGVHAHVSELNRLDDLILVAGIGDLKLVLIIERSLRVPIGTDGKLVADGSLDIQLQVLLEGRIDPLLLVGRNGWVARFLNRRTDVHVGLAGDSQIHFRLSEDGGERGTLTSRDVHLEIEQPALGFVAALRFENELRPVVDRCAL